MPTEGNPPPDAVAAAVRIAHMSPCAKSQRGAAIFWPPTISQPSQIIAVAHNAPPMPFRCTGSDACKSHCNKVAILCRLCKTDHVLTCRGRRA